MPGHTVEKEELVACSANVLQGVKDLPVPALEIRCQAPLQVVLVLQEVHDADVVGVLGRPSREDVPEPLDLRRAAGGEGPGFFPAIVTL